MVNIYKLKLTNLQQEILRLLFIKAGMSLNQRGIARILEVSPPAVMKALPKLEEENLIKIEQDKESKRWSIELNRDNPKIMQLKRVENLKMVYESGLSDFLYNEFPGCTIILFGSYSKGEDVWFGERDDKNSDIDIAVIGIKEKQVNLTKFNKILEKSININFYKSWNDIHKHLKNNLLNGILLSGGIEL